MQHHSGPPGPKPSTTLMGVVRVAAEYLRFRYAGKFLGLYGYLRQLPRQESRLTWSALGTIVLLMITPLLAIFGPRLAPVSFEDAYGQLQSIPVAALVLAFVAFAMSWGYLLAGAAQGPGLLWLVTGLEYVYLVAQIGLILGRSYLHLAVLLLPVVIGALTKDGRLWAKITLVIVL